MATPTAGGFLHWARTVIGDPYVFGAAGPTAFDCSGLVQWALMRAGLRNVPRTSEAQYAWVQHISFSELRPGDLIFEQWPGDQAAPGHVAIFTGTGKIEEAPQPGEPVHEVSWSPGSVTAAGGRIVGYGRVPGLSGTGGGTSATLTSFPGSGILSWPSEITSFFSSLGKAIDWLVQPSHEIRILCGVAGTVAAGSGVFMLSHVGGDMAGGVGVPRAASLPLGILLTGSGAVLLFIAFHNLPANVTNLPELIAWIVDGFKGDTSFGSGSSKTSQPSSSVPHLPQIPGAPLGI